MSFEFIDTVLCERVKTKVDTGNLQTTLKTPTLVPVLTGLGRKNAPIFEIHIKFYRHNFLRNLITVLPVQGCNQSINHPLNNL
jgi:hypothetical protein